LCIRELDVGRAEALRLELDRLDRYAVSYMAVQHTGAGSLTDTVLRDTVLMPLPSKLTELQHKGAASRSGADHEGGGHVVGRWQTRAEGADNVSCVHTCTVACRDHGGGGTGGGGGAGGFLHRNRVIA
jgi:hypothetical protein